MRTCSARTAIDYGFIDGHCLYDDVNQVLMSIIGANRKCIIAISEHPFGGSTNAIHKHGVSGATIYESADGMFTVCNRKVAEYKLGKQFHYKINKT